MQIINESNSWIFEKKNKRDKYTTNLIKITKNTPNAYNWKYKSYKPQSILLKSII